MANDEAAREGDGATPPASPSPFAQPFGQPAAPPSSHPYAPQPPQGYGQHPAYPQPVYGQPAYPQAHYPQPQYPAQPYPAAPYPPMQPAAPQYPVPPQYAQPRPVQPSPAPSFPPYPAAPPGYAAQPTPVRPAAPIPVAPVQVAPVQAAPIQVAPVSVAPVNPTPVAAAPVAPIPVAPTRTASPTPQPVPASAAPTLKTRPAAPSSPPRPMPVPAGGAESSTAARPIPVTDAMAVKDPEMSEEEQQAVVVQSFLKRSPPWLVSTIFHMLLLIVLGLWVLAVQIKPQIELEATVSDDIGEQIDEFTFSKQEELTDAQEEIITPDNLPEVMDPFAAPVASEIALDPNLAMSEIKAPTVGMALSGREKGMKQSLLAAYGGDEKTEDAVQLGLSWLARNQLRDGSWSLSGPYPGGAVNENRAAATAMALLAFQGAGNTHLSGNYKQQVSRGWNWLLKQQDADGNFFQEGSPHHRLYTQAQCTIAICELYGMTKDEKFKLAAERAVTYAVKVQDPNEGGWRYVPGSGADTSVTGWFLMALQSARMAYLAVPEKTLDGIRNFLDSVQTDNGSGYLYMPGSHGGLAMNAEGLLCRQYLGWKADDGRLQEGVSDLNRNPIDWNNRDCYYWYYATQVCHHMEGADWKTWNSQMKKVIPAMQSKKGSERGSWDPDGDQWGGHGGRLYVTCLHIYMLEVYYRHLPIYSYRAMKNELN